MTILHALRSIESCRPLCGRERHARFAATYYAQGGLSSRARIELPPSRILAEGGATIPRCKALVIGQSQAAPLGSPLGGIEPGSGTSAADAIGGHEYDAPDAEEAPPDYASIRGV